MILLVKQVVGKITTSIGAKKRKRIRESVIGTMGNANGAGSIIVETN
jgi:hypothetical protein